MANDFSYDAVSYQSSFQPQLHPDKMATLGALLGLQPAAVENCRYLELGCGEGDNLIGFAAALPESEFVGVDLSARQIETANRAVEDLALKNIEFLHLDVMRLNREEYGQFDYIAAHGLFSWVPDFVRRKVLALYSEMLAAPNGIGYLSYNVLPGGHLRRMMRDMMLYHAQDEPFSLAKVEKGLSVLGFLRDSTAKDEYYQTILKNEIDFVLNHSAQSILHDELGEENQPFYFHEFAKLAAENDLQYLCETEYYTPRLDQFPPPTRQALAVFDDDLIRREQYADFLYCRRFRQTLLCHAGAPLNRNVLPGKLNEFYIASAISPADKNAELETNKIVKFNSPKGVIELDHPLTKVALAHLGSIWTDSIKFGDLMDLARRRIEASGGAIDDWEKALDNTRLILLELYKHSTVELHVYQPKFARAAGEFPRVSPLARRQLARGVDVTTLNNNRFKVEDAFFRQFLLMLDGTRSRLDLKKELRKKISAGEFSETGEKAALLRELPALVRENLAQAAKNGLLIS